MSNEFRRRLAHDLVLPCLLFASLGGMSWAVRGCSGFGAVNGCVFAGVTWGAAWWFISRVPVGELPRPYHSGWIIPALTFGIGMAGNRGWMQWPSFFEGHLQTNAAAGQFVTIPPVYGFVWLFIAGVPWAGLGACLLAWCGSHRRASKWHWAARLGCGVAGAMLARWAFESLPEVFLPLYDSIQSRYADLQSNPNLRRLINDNRAAITHLGLYLGLLGFEAGWRNWRNVVLISTVGLVNGLGWALCQNWRWAAGLWPNVNFNWWRCWESCGGISIGLAYGLAFYLVNHKGIQTVASKWPNLERFAAYAGLILGLGLSLKNGGKGWANIYLGNEDYWNRIFWMIAGPAMLIGLTVAALWIRGFPLPAHFAGDRFPRAYLMIWLVLLVQNSTAQVVTGPHSLWSEKAFAIYYLLLFVISALIVHYCQCCQLIGRVPAQPRPREPGL